MKPLQRARDAAQAFLAPIESNFWEEHGISDDEATLGIIAAFESVGAFTMAEAKAARRALKRGQNAETARWRRKEQARRDKLTPKARAREDSLDEMQRQISEHMMDRFLSHTPFGLLRAAEGDK